MIEFEKSLGYFSEIIPAQLVPETNTPNIVVFSKGDSICLWNPKTKANLALLKEANKFSQTIITVVKLFRIVTSKEILILAGLSSGKILIWKLNITKNLVKFSWHMGHSSRISCIHYSTSDFRILSGCEKGSIVVWDIKVNKGILRNKHSHFGKILNLEFLFFEKNNFSYFFSYSTDNLLKFWDIRTGSCLKLIEVCAEKFLEFKLLKRKNFLIGLTRNGLLIVFKINFPFILKYYGKYQTKKICQNPTLIQDLYQSLLILNTGSGIIEILSLKKTKYSSQKRKKNKISKKPMDFFSNLISYHFKTQFDSFSIWKSRYKEKWIFLMHNLKVHILDFFQFSYEKKSKNKIEMYIKRILKRRLDFHSGEVRSILWFSKDKFLIALCSSSDFLYIWHISLQKCVKIFKALSFYISIRYFGDNSIIMGSNSGNIDIYEISTGKLIFSEIKAHDGPIWSLESAENSYFLGTGSSDGILKIWEMETHRIILCKKLKIQEQILNIKILYHENTLILSGISAVIWVFSLDSLEFKFSLQGHSLPVVSLCLCDDKKTLVSGSADLSLRIWDLREKNQKKVLFPEESVITSIIFQPCSINFLSASRGGNIIFWNGHNYLKLCQFLGYHTGPIWTLSFSENGDYFASGSSDKSILIWKFNFQRNWSKNATIFSTETSSKKTEGKNSMLEKKMVKKFYSILNFICQVKEKKAFNNYGISKLKSYLKNLLFETKRKYIHLFFESMKTFELEVLLKVLTEKKESLVNWNFLQTLPEIFQKIINFKNSSKSNMHLSDIFLAREKIDQVLRLEKIKATRIIKRFQRKFKFY